MKNPNYILERRKSYTVLVRQWLEAKFGSWVISRFTDSQIPTPQISLCWITVLISSACSQS
jgi:hypothetical protein